MERLNSRPVGRRRAIQIISLIDPELGCHDIAVDRTQREGALLQVDISGIGIVPGDVIAVVLLAGDAERDVAGDILIARTNLYAVKVGEVASRETSQPSASSTEVHWPSPIRNCAPVITYASSTSRYASKYL